MNVLDFAMKMEIQGKAFYETQAASTKVPGLRSIFLGLAADEQKHYDFLHGLKEGREHTMANSRMLEQARTVVTKMLAEKAFLELHEDVDGYRLGLKLEAESVKLYEDLAAKEENNPDTVQLYIKLANEEKKHYNILENIIDFVSRPKYYLKWQEYDPEEL